jgi:ABC-type amino acid transport substrate-binding protein
MLDRAARPLPPDPAFAAALLADLADELGFAGTGRNGQTAGTTWRRDRRTSARRRPLELLLIAVIAVGASAGLLASAGAIRDRLATPARANVLADLQRTGHVRIAIRPDHPQFTLGGQTATGFDADVAIAIARRLGVAPDVVIEDEATMVQQRHGEAWDIALPSVPIWTIDASTFLVSAPYYRWPHLLIVPANSVAQSVQDIAVGPVCAVAGDAGDAWLNGAYGGASTTAPVSSRVVTRATDVECLAALASGDAIAVVTANTSAADVAVHADLRVIGGPNPEPRAAIVPFERIPAADAAPLVQAINDAIAALRADGTLAQRSQARFGGADLSTP